MAWSKNYRYGSSIGTIGVIGTDANWAHPAVLYLVKLFGYDCAFAKRLDTGTGVFIGKEIFTQLESIIDFYPGFNSFDVENFYTGYGLDVIRATLPPYTYPTGTSLYYYYMGSYGFSQSEAYGAMPAQTGYVTGSTIGGQITGTLRGAKKGLSTLGGAVRVYAFSVDQFEENAFWPTRTLIQTSTYNKLQYLPVISGQKGARLIFDFDAKGHGKSEGFTTASQFGYKHSFSGKVAGITAESDATMDEMAGLDLILIAEMPDGRKKVFGSTVRPMRLKVDDDWGGKSTDYVGSTIEFTQVDGVDFKPALLSNSVSIPVNTLPAYS